MVLCPRVVRRIDTHSVERVDLLTLEGQWLLAKELQLLMDEIHIKVASLQLFLNLDLFFRSKCIEFVVILHQNAHRIHIEFILLLPDVELVEIFYTHVLYLTQV